MNDDQTPADGPPAHPLRRLDDDPPPPRREQLPLPRRARQRHLEPQLREPGGSGDGTPFAAFADDVDPAGDDTRPRAAEFRDGTARGRGPQRPGPTP